MSDCIFCKIVRKEIPCQKVFESETVLGFKDISPQHPIHYLFIPKEHHTSLAELPAERVDAMADIFRAIKEVSERDGFAKQGYRVVINTGAQGGQTVFHLHVHLMSGHPMSAKF